MVQANEYVGLVLKEEPDHDLVEELAPSLLSILVVQANEFVGLALKEEPDHDLVEELTPSLLSSSQPKA